MKPEAGQTWVNEKFGDKVYFIGRCANGIMVFQVEGNEIEHGDLDWSGWRLMQPEDTACDECGGSGEIDSGGCTPWMAPINVPCGKCAQPEPQPAEDPDEWVILDPVKYADHVPRVGIDEFTTGNGRWQVQRSGHVRNTVGYWKVAEGLEHRCRRRDLPKVEQPEPTTDKSSPVQATSSGYKKACEIVAALPLEERNALLLSGLSHNPAPRECQPLKPTADHRILGDPAGGVTMQRQCAVDKPQPQKTRVRLWATPEGRPYFAPFQASKRDDEIRVDSEGFYVEGGQS